MALSPALLGAALRTLRQRRGLTQAEAADSVGIQRTYLSQLESGEMSDQTKRLLDLLLFFDAELIIRDRRVDVGR